MPVLLDTGILYAYYDRSDAWHRRAFELIQAEEGGLIVPAPVLPEVDFLVGRRLGARARQVLYRGLTEGYYFVADLPRDQYARVAELNRRYTELDLGFVDAAVVALAGAIGLRRVATTDRRHFTPLAGPLGLELLP
jgi:hypothetical protein